MYAANCERFKVFGETGAKFKLIRSLSMQLDVSTSRFVADRGEFTYILSLCMQLAVNASRFVADRGRNLDSFFHYVCS